MYYLRHLSFRRFEDGWTVHFGLERPQRGLDNEHIEIVISGYRKHWIATDVFNSHAANDPVRAHGVRDDGNRADDRDRESRPFKFLRYR
jgi:hypothetical protein